MFNSFGRLKQHIVDTLCSSELHKPQDKKMQKILKAKTSTDLATQITQIIGTQSPDPLAWTLEAICKELQMSEWDNRAGLVPYFHKGGIL